MQLVIAEKPSVARDLARVLGVRPAGKGAFEGQGRVITWCVGHLVELEEPAAYDQRWKSWRLETLPIIPSAFRLRPVEGTRDQLRAVRDLLRDRRFDEVVNACDAGREGELIFRYVYELAGSRLPVRRLWISSLTDEAIRQGFASLRPGVQLDPLADAARCRSEADWLVGMNATRAVTVRHRTGQGSTLYSIGRVQTPTLALLVDRERAIRAFQPRDYWEVRGTFAVPGASEEHRPFDAPWTHGKATRLGAEPLAGSLLDRLRPRAAADAPEGPVVESVRDKRLREPPPLLFDLTSLQRTANRRFGLSATATLEAAQALYERHKILTYPRTDSRHLSSDLAAELPKLLRGISGYQDYAAFAAPLLATPPQPGRRVFDDQRVQDHHAIIPTGKVVPLEALGRDERRIFDLVVRRFLGAFYPDAEFAVTRAVIRVGPQAAGASPVVAPRDAPPPARRAGGAPEGADKEDETILDALPPPPDRFVARGRVRLAAGWQAVAGIGAEPRKEGDGARGTAGEGEGPDLPPLSEGQRLSARFAVARKQTKPPPRHTEGTLLSAMETAGRAIDDEDLRAAMKDTGLGTPATRAATIETLVKRGFIVRDGKQLTPTSLGLALIEALPVSSLASAELTGSWEARLARIARGEERRAAFMEDIARYVRELVAAVRSAPVNSTMASAATPPPAGAPPGRASRADRAEGGPRGGRARRPSGRAAGETTGAGRAVRPSTSGRATRPTPGARPAPPTSEGVAARPTTKGRAATPTKGRAATPTKERAATPTKERAATPRRRAPGAAAGSVGGGPGARTDDGPALAATRSAAAEAGAAGRRAPEAVAVTSAASSSTSPPASGLAASSGASASLLSDLRCPRCGLGGILAGRRGWGCTRWRQGCSFVVWFEIEGRRLSEGELRTLIANGRSATTVARPGGAAVAGQLVLDVSAERGAVRFEPI